nr:unnamed protein product [Callosobruchus chinensis]
MERNPPITENSLIAVLLVDSVTFAIVTKAGASEANHLRKRFLTLCHNLSLTLRYAFHFELDESRAFS